MNSNYFYVRVQIELIPPEKQKQFALNAERNYPVLGIDAEKNRLLLHDDQMRLLWLPMAVCRFVRLA